MVPSLRKAALYRYPADTCVYVTPAGKTGTLHWPLVFMPHATSVPSLRRKSVQYQPASASTYVSPGGSTGTLHSPWVLRPQATAEPSLRSAAAWRPAPEIAV